MSRRSTDMRHRRRGSLTHKKLFTEQLEARLLLAADLGHAHPLFAPGTPAEYVEQFHDDDHGDNDHGHNDDHGDVSEIALFQFDDSDRWNNTAVSGGGLSQGDPTTITWSIVPDGTNINGFIGEAQSPSNFVQVFRGIYGLAHDPSDTDYSGEAWFQALTESFDRWEELSGIDFVYESNDDGANFGFFNGLTGVRGDIRIGGHRLDGNSGTLAYNFFPNTSDMVIDTADGFYANTSANSLRLRNVVMHEVGHGLGISHVESNNGSFLMEPFINLGFDGPQLDDILAVQRGYGDASEANETAGTATPLGSVAAGSTVSVGTDGIDRAVAASEVDFVTIDDNSDVDFYSFTVGANSAVSLTLTPVGPTYNQGPQGGTQTTFNASAQSDLTLQLFDSDGTTVLATANAGGVGSTESISDFLLTTGGTYYARITGANNAIQLYQLDVQAESSEPLPGVIVTPTGGSTDVSEAGATDTYTISLNTQPTADVNINVGQDAQLTSSATTLTFTIDNWNTPQTVTIGAVDDDDVEGNHTGNITHTASSSDSDYNGIAINGLSVNVTDNDSPPPADDLYFSLQSNTTLNGLTVQNEDIVVYDGENFEILFDGSDVGLANMRIDAFDVVSSTEILISLDAAVGNVDDSDVLLFRATSLGANTAGSFAFYIDGSDVGLSTNAEDVDGITRLDDGTILLSTRGSGSAAGLSLFRDEDIIRFRPTQLGSATRGSFELSVDGSTSTYGLANRSEDINGFAAKGADLFLTTTGSFSVPGGLAGNDDDVFSFNTAGSRYNSELALNLSSNDIWGLDFPGIASASAIGLGSNGSLTNPYVEFASHTFQFGNGQREPDASDDSARGTDRLSMRGSAVQQQMLALRRQVAARLANIESFDGFQADAIVQRIRQHQQAVDRLFANYRGPETEQEPNALDLSPLVRASSSGSRTPPR